MKSFAEFNKNKEESKTDDDFLSENLYTYDQESPLKLYEEEEPKLNDDIISDKEIDESYGNDRYHQELASKLNGQDENDGFRQMCNLKFEILDSLSLK